MKLYDVANSLPVKRNLTGPFLLTPWLDMSLSLIQDDYYWKRVECCIELLFGSSQRQFHSEQKIMESRSCGPDVHSPAMSTYIYTHSRGGFNGLLVFLPSAKVNPLRSLKRPVYRDLLKFSAFSTNEPHSGSAAIPMRPWGKSCIATGGWIEEMWFVRCLASAEPLKPPKQWHQTYLLFIELCNPYLYHIRNHSFPTITYI